MTRIDAKAVFWDNDGVLVDTERLYLDATQRVLATIGISLTETDYLEWFLKRGVGAWHLAEARGIAADEIDRLRDERNALYADLLRESPRVLPGVIEALSALHGRCIMGVVTTSRRDHFDVMHERTGLLPYFDFVLANGDYARSKPEPDPYLRAIERAGLASEACLAIEDTERGLEAATRAGLRCIVIPTPLTCACQFVGAHRVVKTAHEIPALLRG